MLRSCGTRLLIIESYLKIKVIIIKDTVGDYNLFSRQLMQPEHTFVKGLLREQHIFALLHTNFLQWFVNVENNGLAAMQAKQV